MWPMPPEDEESEFHERRRQVKLHRRQLAVGFGLTILLALVIGLAIAASHPDTSSTTSSTAAQRANSTTTSLTKIASPSPVVYSATLSGTAETPVVRSSAGGSLRLSIQGDAAQYTLTVSKLSNAIVARLHEGKAEAQGLVIATLFAGPSKRGAFTGVLAQGTLKAVDLGGPLRGSSLAELSALTKAGDIYLNVGSTAHPSGELRGQLR
jgi:CHRD domain